jgi:hypothetical protein
MIMDVKSHMHVSKASTKTLVPHIACTNIRIVTGDLQTTSTAMLDKFEMLKSPEVQN